MIQGEFEDYVLKNTLANIHYIDIASKSYFNIWIFKYLRYVHFRKTQENHMYCTIGALDLHVTSQKVKVWLQLQSPGSSLYDGIQYK